MSSVHYPAGAGRMSRRDFLKLMAAAGTVMTFAPFVDWGKFLPNTSASVAEKAKIEIRGGPANVYSFPVNRSEVGIKCNNKKRKEVRLRAGHVVAQFDALVLVCCLGSRLVHF
ncbi:MAG TPA: twin-arginine translocation signal domain-containing protein [Nitrososphaera sp.]|nr:twin-arginine translocation signal domain-containing protein [Nitrososphaera sp.]